MMTTAAEAADRWAGFQAEERVNRIREAIARCCAACGRRPEGIRLLAATKTVPAWIVNQVIDAGVGDIGENRSNELLEKYEDYHRDKCRIHFIGSLQTNKVRQVVGRASMIQSVNSLHLAGEIQRQCEKKDQAMDVLLEINIGREESKSGMRPEELEEALYKINQFQRLRVKGLMAIPPAAVSDKEKEKYFYDMNQIFVDIKSKSIDNIHMDCLSMGMSGDYLLAIKHGSNMIRLGTALFGAR